MMLDRVQVSPVKLVPGGEYSWCDEGMGIHLPCLLEVQYGKNSEYSVLFCWMLVMVAHCMVFAPPHHPKTSFDLLGINCKANAAHKAHVDGLRCLEASRAVIHLQAEKMESFICCD